MDCVEHAVVPAPWTQTVQSGARVLQQFAALPFDVMREEYANSVRAGLLPRSMLAARDFARALERCERLYLGPWARRV